jgi:hypothetical protein
MERESILGIERERMMACSTVASHMDLGYVNIHLELGTKDNGIRAKKVDTER